MSLMIFQDKINKRADEVIKHMTTTKNKCGLAKGWVMDEIIRNENKNNLEIIKIIKEIIKQDIKEIEFMKNNPDEEHNFHYYSSSPLIDIDFIKQFNNKLSVCYLMENVNFDISWVSACPDMDWNFNLISDSDNFNIEWLYKYPRKKWDAREIEKKECFFYDLIEIFDNFKWSSKILKKYIKIQQYKEKHKRKYKDVLDEYLSVVFHPDNAERLGLFDDISKDDFEN